MSREIDAEIAEKVFRMRIIKSDGKIHAMVKGDDRITPWEKLPAYSTSIADAWKVVEKMYQSGWKLELFVGLGLTDARFWRNGTSHEGRAHNERSAPMAICLAAIQSLRTEKTS